MTDWIGEIEARANAATAGPWEQTTGNFVVADCGCVPTTGRIVAEVDCCKGKAHDLTFIAAAREDIPRLCATLRAVEALAEEAEQEVEYCNPAVVRVDALRRTLKGEA